MKHFWDSIVKEAIKVSENEPLISACVKKTVLNHDSFSDGLGFHLAKKLQNESLPRELLIELFSTAIKSDFTITNSAKKDIEAVISRDPAADSLLIPFLYFKGFHALQSFRITHWLWKENRKALAFCLQNRISEAFGVDIHPAATIGSGILIDHATGVVIGETSIVEDNVSILHEVTLGGTGKDSGDRHPKIRHGVLIGAGAKILGNIEIGEGAKIGAGSVVLDPVPPHVTVAGVPAKIVGKTKTKEPALNMNHCLKE